MMERVTGEKQFETGKQFDNWLNEFEDSLFESLEDLLLNYDRNNVARMAADELLKLGYDMDNLVKDDAPYLLAGYSNIPEYRY